MTPERLGNKLFGGLWCMCANLSEITLTSGRTRILFWPSRGVSSGESWGVILWLHLYAKSLCGFFFVRLLAAWT